MRQATTFSWLRHYHCESAVAKDSCIIFFNILYIERVKNVCCSYLLVWCMLLTRASTIQKFQIQTNLSHPERKCFYFSNLKLNFIVKGWLDFFFFLSPFALRGTPCLSKNVEIFLWWKSVLGLMRLFLYRHYTINYIFPAFFDTPLPGFHEGVESKFCYSIL